jgi:hypothetical protein
MCGRPARGRSTTRERVARRLNAAGPEQDAEHLANPGELADNGGPVPEGEPPASTDSSSWTICCLPSRPPATGPPSRVRDSWARHLPQECRTRRPAPAQRGRLPRDPFLHGRSRRSAGVCGCLRVWSRAPLQVGGQAAALSPHPRRTCPHIATLAASSRGDKIAAQHPLFHNDSGTLQSDYPPRASSSENLRNNGLSKPFVALTSSLSKPVSPSDPERCRHGHGAIAGDRIFAVGCLKVSEPADLLRPLQKPKDRRHWHEEIHNRPGGATAHGDYEGLGDEDVRDGDRGDLGSVRLRRTAR